MTTQFDPALRYSLDKAFELIAEYQPPGGSFDPHGDWRHSYLIYTNSHGSPAEQGRLVITRRHSANRPAGETPQLEIRCRRKGTSGFHHFIEAALNCLANPLSTPSSWTFTSKIARPFDAPAYLQTDQSKELSVVDDRLTISSNGTSTTRSVRGDYTCLWCLFDGVQRLSTEGMKPLHFSLIDEFDQVTHGHRLTFRGRQSVVMNGTQHLLTAYDLIGPGVIPYVFWRDETGRLLFVISGIELYVLTDAAVSTEDDTSS